MKAIVLTSFDGVDYATDFPLVLAVGTDAVIDAIVPGLNAGMSEVDAEATIGGSTGVAAGFRGVFISGGAVVVGDRLESVSGVFAKHTV